MHILCLGINHTTAPIDFREKLAFDEESIRSTLARLSTELGYVSEIVFVSTCNRIELYVASSQLLY